MGGLGLLGGGRAAVRRRGRRWTLGVAGWEWEQPDLGAEGARGAALSLEVAESGVKDCGVG